MRSRALSNFNTALLRAGGGRGGGSAVAPARAVSSSTKADVASSSPASAAASTSTSSSTNTNSCDGAGAGDAGDSALHRPLRLLLFATLAGAAAAVLPQTFAPSPQAAVSLLRADSARLRAAGAERAARIGGGSSKSAGSLAAVPGAAAALLDASFRECEGVEDQEAAAAALKAALAWAAHPEGATALRKAGAAERAEAAMKNGLSAEPAEDARHLCWLLGQRE